MGSIKPTGFDFSVCGCCAPDINVKFLVEVQCLCPELQPDTIVRGFELATETVFQELHWYTETKWKKKGNQDF